MIERGRFIPTEGAIIAHNDASISDVGDTCTTIRGTHFCPASALQVGSSRGFARLFMSEGRSGYYLNLTPKGARQVALALMNAAAATEAEMASAGEQLAATLAKKGDQA